MTFAAAIVRTAVLPAAVGLASLVAAGCATVPAAGDPALPPELARRLTPAFRHDHVAPARSTRSEIGTDVLGVEPGRPVYEIVERRWPQMLRPALLGMPGYVDRRGDVIGVYTKAGWLGGQETLRVVLASQVLALYRITPAEEFARFGRRHPGGAVEIVWR